MQRKIQSFVQDDRDRWVAQLACGHLAEVPADAPPPLPQWSRSEHGRKNLVGSLLPCPSCPDDPDDPGEVRPPAEAHALATQASPYSFWRRAKAAPGRVQPVRIDSKVAFGVVRSVPDLERLARLGFHDVVCLDQAGEPGQALSPHVAASWARALALTPHWIPMDPARILDEEVERFVNVVRAARGPILIHSNGPERAVNLLTILHAFTHDLDASEALHALTDLGIPTDVCSLEFVERQLGTLRDAISSPADVPPHSNFASPAPELAPVS